MMKNNLRIFSGSKLNKFKNIEAYKEEVCTSEELFEIRIEIKMLGEPTTGIKVFHNCQTQF